MANVRIPYFIARYMSNPRHSVAERVWRIFNCKQTSPSILNADFQDLPRVKFIEIPIFNCTEPALTDWQTQPQQISTLSPLLVGVCLNIGFPAISSAGPPGTAPFPFCGNRFEFRAVGSSQNCCFQWWFATQSCLQDRCPDCVWGERSKPGFQVATAVANGRRD